LPDVPLINPRTGVVPNLYLGWVGVIRVWSYSRWGSQQPSSLGDGSELIITQGKSWRSSSQCEVSYIPEPLPISPVLLTLPLPA
jgi:hypothetical protein